MLKSFVPWTLLFIVFIAFAALFKPATKFLIGSYASIVLDANVTVESLEIMNSTLTAVIDEKENIVHLKLLNISPIELQVVYDGDAAALRKYLPLTGRAHVQAELVYDKTLRELNFKARSKQLKLQKQMFKNINLNASLEEKNFNIRGFFIAPITGKTEIKGAGTLGKNLQAQADINFADKHIRLSSIELTQEKKLSLKISIFDGKVALSLENKKLAYHLQHINTEKVLRFVKKNMPLSGYVNADGLLNLASMSGEFSADSEEFKAYNQTLKKLSVDGKICLKTVDFKLHTQFMKQDVALEGNVDYAREPKITLFSTKFESESKLVYEQGHFWLKAKHLNAEAVQKAFGLQEYVDAEVDLTAQGTLEDIDFTLKSPSLRVLKYPKYFKNAAAVALSGKLKKGIVQFQTQLHNENFRFISREALYNLHSKELKLPAQLELLAENRKRLIDIQLQTLLKKPYTSKALIVQGKDKIVLNNFSYTQKEGIKSDFVVDIQELQKYKIITKVDMKGALKVRGKYDKNLLITTSSLGGKLEIEVERDALFVTLRALELQKIDNMLNKDTLFSKGSLSGNISYHIPTKSASSYITVSDAVLNGIDIDAKLSKLENTLGLNVIDLGREALKTFEYSKQRTTIQKAQINLSLNERIVTFDDVALATKKFRIAALGSMYDNGDIIHLSVNILDKQGCAILTQELSGNIRAPQVTNSSGALVDLVSHVPSALVNTGRKIIDFGTNSVDKVATFAINTAYISDKKISLTNDIAHGADTLITDTSTIVLPRGCRVVYRGKVKQPKAYKLK